MTNQSHSVTIDLVQFNTIFQPNYLPPIITSILVNITMLTIRKAQSSSNKRASHFRGIDYELLFIYLSIHVGFSLSLIPENHSSYIIKE
jgi:hypothetical protein